MFSANLLLSLLLILVVAWLLGSLFSRYGLPVMLGELLAGVILGPSLLGLVTPSPSLDLMAELGIFFVMFYTGMEMNPRELLEHFWPSLAVAFGGFVLPFGLGFLVSRGFGGTVLQSLFVGMGVSITAIAVQAVILQSLKIHKTDLGHIIIGAAIADDIFSLITLSLLLGLAKAGSVAVGDILLVSSKVVAFFGATILLGHFVVPRFTRKLHDREGRAFTFAMTSALVMAYLADMAGLHVIIGAFLAGQFVREEVMDKKIYDVISDRFFGLSYGFLVPIYFATLSFHIVLYREWSFIIFTSALILAAIAGKVFGCGLGFTVFRRSLWESAIVGFGMNGRGAVELVVASVAIELSDELTSSGIIAEPLLTGHQFSALVLMAFITTLIAPLSLKWAVLRACGPGGKAVFCRLWNGGA